MVIDLLGAIGMSSIGLNICTVGEYLVCPSDDVHCLRVEEPAGE